MKIKVEKKITKEMLVDFYDTMDIDYYIGVPEIGDVSEMLLEKAGEVVGAYTYAKDYLRWEIVAFEQGSFAEIPGANNQPRPYVYLDGPIMRVDTATLRGKMLMKIVITSTPDDKRVKIKYYSEELGCYQVASCRDKDMQISKYGIGLGYDAEELIKQIVGYVPW
jgi:hypothetical protein